jgi:hypothetical protein
MVHPVADHPPTRRYDDGTTEVATSEAATTPVAASAVAPAGAAVRPSGSSARYVPGAEIARGGMGRVVVGTDTRLGREVAIKEALPHGADLERFEREVRITARLEHPSIVPLYDAGVGPSGRPFYVMRKVSGQPLERLIAERSGHDAERARGRGLDDRLALLPHVLAAAHALGHAHRRGVIHRDVKPANILVGELGETVVIDWGLAKVIGEDDTQAPPVDRAIAPSGEVATQAGAVFGTPGFMAPEQARGETLDARSDVYALGATLYTVLAGVPPPHGSIAEEVERAQRKHHPEPASTVNAVLRALPLPPELITIVAQAMRTDPASRYPDGAALADDLSRFLAGRLVEAHRYTPAQRLRRFVRRHRALVAVIASSVLVVAVGGVLAIRGIVLERERARQAERDAVAGQRAAEHARERETDRADDAVILKAHAQLDRDPTAAVATLKTLAPESRRWPQARPIAIEARLQGIAHVYRADVAARVFELAPDPRSLLVVGSVTGRVSIIDLEHSRERELVAAPGRRTAAWGERGAVVWIAPATGGLYAVDVATGAQRPAILAETIEQLRADHAASYLAFALRDGGAGWVDSAGVHYLHGFTSQVQEVRVAPDGAWAAFATTHELVVVDRDGRELARETDALQTATLGYAASGQQLAILTGRGVVIEIDVTGGRASSRRVTVPWRVFFLAYVSDTTYVNLRSAVEMRPLHDLENRGRELGHVWGSTETWQRSTAVASDTLQLIGPGTTRTLWPPVRGVLQAVAGRRNARYLALFTRGAVATWDLGDMLPDLVATDVHRTWLFDDRTAVVSDLVKYEWVDLVTGVRTPIKLPPGFVVWQTPDPETGRQLLLLERKDQPNLAVIAHPGRSEVTPVDVPALHRVDFAGLDLVAGTTTGELVVVGDRPPPRVVHRFDTAVEDVFADGTWIVGKAESGMLARFDRATGRLDTGRPPFDITYATLTLGGDVYLATGRDVVRWRGQGFARVATLPSAIRTIADIRGRDSVVATTVEGAVYAIDPDLPEAERVTRQFFRSASLPQFVGANRYMAVDTIEGEVTVLDLATDTRWQLPQHHVLNSISLTGQTALLFSGGRVSAVHVDVPDDPAKLHAWVVQATNHTLDATGR